MKVKEEKEIRKQEKKEGKDERNILNWDKLECARTTKKKTKISKKCQGYIGAIPENRFFFYGSAGRTRTKWRRRKPTTDCKRRKRSTKQEDKN